jgi:hypothetical protein
MRLGKAIIPIILIIIAAILIIYGLTPQQQQHPAKAINVSYLVRFYDKADHIITTPLNVTLYKDSKIVSQLNGNSTGWYTTEKVLPDNYTLVVRLGNLTLYQKNINLNNNITESKVTINVYPLYVNLHPFIDNKTNYNITDVDAVIYALNGTPVLKQSISESKQTNVIYFPVVPEGSYILKVNWLGINIYSRNIIVNGSLSNIDVNVTGRIITFKIYDQDKMPINNATLELYYNGLRVLMGQTLSTNNYAVSAVLPRLTYDVRVSLYGLNAIIKNGSTLDLENLKGNIYNVTVLLTKNINIRILNPDNTPANGLSLTLKNNNGMIASALLTNNATFHLPPLPSNSNLILSVYREGALALNTTLSIPPPTNNTVTLMYKINEITPIIHLYDANNNALSDFSGNVYLIDKFNNNKIIYNKSIQIIPSNYLIIVLNRMPDESLVPIYMTNETIDIIHKELSLILPINIKLEVQLNGFNGDIVLKYVGINGNSVYLKMVNNTNNALFELPRGTYILEVYSNGKLVYSKFVILNNNAYITVQLKSPGIISSIDVEVLRSIFLFVILALVGFASLRFYKQYKERMHSKEIK